MQMSEVLVCGFCSRMGQCSQLKLGASTSSEVIINDVRVHFGKQMEDRLLSSMMAVHTHRAQSSKPTP